LQGIQCAFSWSRGQKEERKGGFLGGVSGDSGKKKNGDADVPGLKNWFVVFGKKKGQPTQF